MPHTSHRVQINASIDTIWKLLIDKIDHPERYVPGIEKVEIPQRFSGDDIERIMYLTGGKAIHELIAANEQTHTVIFKLVGDPVYTGVILNTIFEEDDKVWLTFSQNWTPKPGNEPPESPDWSKTIKEAVEHTQKLAEQS